MLGTVQRQNSVDFGLPCWPHLPLLGHWLEHLVEVVDPVVDLGELVVGPAVAAGLQLPVVAVGPDCCEVVVAAGVAVDLLSPLLALLLLLVLALWQQSVWLL